MTAAAGRSSPPSQQIWAWEAAAATHDPKSLPAGDTSPVTSVTPGVPPLGGSGPRSFQHPHPPPLLPQLRPVPGEIQGLLHRIRHPLHRIRRPRVWICRRWAARLGGQRPAGVAVRRVVDGARGVRWACDAPWRSVLRRACWEAAYDSFCWSTACVLLATTLRLIFRRRWRFFASASLPPIFDDGGRSFPRRCCRTSRPISMTASLPPVLTSVAAPCPGEPGGPQS